MGSSFKLWSKRLTEEDTLSRGQIGQFCHAISAGARGYLMGGAHTNLTEHECSHLMDLFYDRCRELDGGGFKLTPEQTRFGVEWLNNDSKRAESVGVTPFILRRFVGFRFVETVSYSRGVYGHASTVPVYRVLYLDDGRHSIDYSWAPWQRNWAEGNVYV